MPKQKCRQRGLGCNIVAGEAPLSTGSAHADRCSGGLRTGSHPVRSACSYRMATSPQAAAASISTRAPRLSLARSPKASSTVTKITGSMSTAKGPSPRLPPHHSHMLGVEGSWKPYGSSTEATHLYTTHLHMASKWKSHILP